jgi:hypothetical protein
MIAAVAALGAATPAFAISNPIVANFQPVGGSKVQGNATFFQLGANVNVGVNLTSDPAGANALDLRKGSCKSYAAEATWPLGTIDGASSQESLPKTKLASLVGDIILIHRTKELSSPPIACAEIKG